MLKSPYNEDPVLVSGLIRDLYLRNSLACKAPHHFCQRGLDGGDGQKLLGFGRARQAVPTATFFFPRVPIKSGLGLS